MNQWLDSTVEAYKQYFGETKHPVVYDVGSRDGRDGIELAERIGGKINKDVVLFEPNPAQAEHIRTTYPQATTIEIAASDKAGTADFLKITSNDINAIGTSSLDIHHPETKQGQKDVIQVTTERLDKIIPELGHETIDIMKIDTEGFTWEVLQGLGDLLKNVLVLHLETEIAGVAINKNNLEVFEHMRDRGFLCFAREHEWGEAIEDQVWVNVRRIQCDQKNT